MKKKLLTAVGVIGGITATAGVIFGIKKKKKYAEQ